MDLFPIILTDLFQILKEHILIKRLILTSRTEVVGALGLLKTYFIQKGLRLEEPKKREDKILETTFIMFNREFEILVPYSTSPRLTEKLTTKNELVTMYTTCLR